MVSPRNENRRPMVLRSPSNNATFYEQDVVKENEKLKNEVGRLRSELQHIKDDRDEKLALVRNLKVDNANLKESIEKSSLGLDSLLPKIYALEENCSSQRRQIQSLQHQLEVAHQKLKEYEEEKEKIKELQDEIRKLHDVRRNHHNTIMELKGNIRVFCRVRPALPGDDSTGKDGSVFSYPTSIGSIGEGIELMHNSQKYSFIFDKVFSHEASQIDVFEDISQLVQSALDGYKVCIFAYGQTGSGKTYTMIGKQDSPDQKGLVPRSLEQIFNQIKKDWKYRMQASMLEIYNEKIRDLLVPSCSENDVHASGMQHTIRHDANGNAYVTDLTVVDVNSSEEVSYLLQQAVQSRSVGRTQMNEQSSRSHFVIILRICGLNESTGEQVQGALNLIDLAGSERLDKSGCTGDRLKETQAINASLSALGNVISALIKKKDHVPFRNSKLTYLLQPCLDKDSKALMFVNISPEASFTGESLCSLRFADKVNRCRLGIPRRHT